MSIADGFQLWIGKQLAEMATVVFIFAALALGAIFYVTACAIIRALRRKDQHHG